MTDLQSTSRADARSGPPVLSKTLLVLLVLALVWLTAWQIAGYHMNEAGLEKLARADHVRTPATRLERGAEVRVEGTVVEGPKVVAPHSRRPCLAAVTNILIVSHYRDIHDRPASDSRLVATRTVGPPTIEIAVGEKRIELPLDRWSPRSSSLQSMTQLPPHLGVTAEEIARAKERLHDGSTGFSISESTLDGGTRVFVAGRLEDRDGPLRLEADPVLGRIEIYPGSQDDFVKEMHGSGGGLRVAAWILRAGVGPLPLAILGLVVLVRRRKRSTPSAEPRA